MSEQIQPIGHHIDGHDVFEGDIVDRQNPANNDEVVARFHDGTPQIMDAAIDAAGRAFERWADVTPSLRGKVLSNAAVLLNTPQWRKRFVDAMVAEIGKTAGGADGEVTKTVNILEYMGGLPKHTRGDVINADQPSVHMYTVSEPVGVAGLVTPFNFPLAVAVWKMAAALAAGCTTVIKPSPFAPMTSALIVELFKEAMAQVKPLKDANIGPGVINVVHGGPDIVSALIRNQLIQAISFTGSTPAGKDIMRQAFTREGQPLDPAHFLAEMGGHNAILVLADANLKMAVSAAVGGMAIGEGQRCTATKRILVDEAVADEFLEMFLDQLGTLKVGPGSDPTSDVGPLVSPDSLARVLAAIDLSQKNGMELLFGGQRLTDGALARGNFMAPTVLKGDPRNPEHVALRREIFGPVAGFGVVHGLDEGIEAVSDSTHRHVAGIFTESYRAGKRFLKKVRTGMRHWNNTTLGGDVQGPFGGAGGDTSFGPQEMGRRAMEIFQRRATIGEHYGDKVLGGRDR